ncbi:IS1182 family transposase [Geobacter anodireducens]|nr:IS1182 family transposase [Geobacter soli]
MLRSRLDHQTSFYDANYVCERLIPKDSFYRKFKEIVSPLIDDKQFESMYCKNNGRPPISPALLAMATILQHYRDLSDREMERACMFDIEIKYALGLQLDERPFDHSSLGDFRKRLLENGKEKETFDRILAHLINAGLIKKDEIQRIDATHVLADVAIPTMVTLVKKGIYEILKPLTKRHKDVHSEIEKEIDLKEYSKQEVNHDAPGRLDIDNRKQKLVDVVNDARKVLKHVKGIKGDDILSRRVDLLKRILQENITEDETGIPKERDHKNKPQDILVSPVDPDARYGAKSNTKRFTGYKANITETVESRFITNIKPMRGNRHDGSNMVEAVIEQKHQHGLQPAKLVGDTAYGDGIARKDLQNEGTIVVAQLKTVNDRTKAIYPKSMFDYDEANNLLTCPAGITVKQSYWDRQKEIRTFHFPMTECGKCPRKTECTNSKDGRRTVGISKVNKELREAEIYNRTDQFKADMKLRQAVEGKLSELVRYHGMRRARYRGLNKVGLQCYFAALAVNIKRWIKLELEKLKPKTPKPAMVAV